MQLITVTETMRRLSIGRTTVYKMIGDGRLQSVTIGKSRRIQVQCVVDIGSGVSTPIPNTPTVPYISSKDVIADPAIIFSKFQADFGRREYEAMILARSTDCATFSNNEVVQPTIAVCSRKATAQEPNNV